MWDSNCTMKNPSVVFSCIIGRSNEFSSCVRNFISIKLAPSRWTAQLSTEFISLHSPVTILIPSFVRPSIRTADQVPSRHPGGKLYHEALRRILMTGTWRVLWPRICYRQPYWFRHDSSVACSSRTCGEAPESIRGKWAVTSNDDRAEIVPYISSYLSIFYFFLFQISIFCRSRQTLFDFD